MATTVGSPDVRQSPPKLSPARRWPPVVWWAIVGAFFAVVELVVYASWILEGQAHPTHTGSTPVPSSTKFWAWTFQGLSVLVLVLVIIHCIRENRRQGRFSLDSMICIGFLAVFWQDTLCNYLRPIFFYNSYLVNLGAWNPHIPGWISPNAHFTPEPLLLSGPIYGWWFVCFAMFFCWCARKARGRWPAISRVKLFFIGVVMLAVLDAVIEGIVNKAGLWAYPSTIKSLTLFGGHTFQYPYYEGLLVGIFCSTVGLIRLGRDDRGLSALERGVDEMNLTKKQRAFVSTLTLVALSNVMFVVLNVGYIWIGLYANKQPAYPSYMTNHLCGQVTYPCPARNVPIVLDPHNVGS